MNPYDEQDFRHASRLVNQRQYFQRRPQSAADLIAKLMARKGYGQQTAAEELSSVWQSVAAEEWRNQTQPGNLRGGVLEVNVANSMLLQRLEFEKRPLVAAIQQQLPQLKLKDIRFRLGNVKHNG